MDCSLETFQSLDFDGVVDDGGQVTFSNVSLVDVSPTNPAAYCSVRGVIGPGASSIVMKLPMTIPPRICISTAAPMAAAKP